MNKYKSLRLAAGLTRKDVAIILEISIYHVRNIETGQRSPGKNILLKMSKLYKCKVEDLLTAS